MVQYDLFHKVKKSLSTRSCVTKIALQPSIFEVQKCNVPFQRPETLHFLPISQKFGLHDSELRKRGVPKYSFHPVEHKLVHHQNTSQMCKFFSTIDDYYQIIRLLFVVITLFRFVSTFTHKRSNLMDKPIQISTAVLQAAGSFFIKDFQSLISSFRIFLFVFFSFVIVHDFPPLTLFTKTPIQVRINPTSFL